MKWLFLLASILCAASLSVLSVIFATGRIPFRANAERTQNQMKPKPATEQPQEETLSVFPSEADIVNELQKALQAERDQYESKIADLEAREQALLEREKIDQALKTELLELQNKLDARIVEMEDSEAGNFRRLATIYAQMDPKNAATLLIEMETERAAKILNLIGDRQAGTILDAAIAKGDSGIKTAGRWTDAIRRIKKSKKVGN